MDFLLFFFYDLLSFIIRYFDRELFFSLHKFFLYLFIIYHIIEELKFKILLYNNFSIAILIFT